jgi:hypothetical protein
MIKKTLELFLEVPALGVPNVRSLHSLLISVDGASGRFVE